jgi:hypothetical protein
VSNVPDNNAATQDKVYSILEEKKDAIDNSLFLYQGSEPSTVYRYDGFISGLKVMAESGVNGKFYYTGDDSENGYKYGLVNLAGTWLLVLCFLAPIVYFKTHAIFFVMKLLLVKA